MKKHLKLLTVDRVVALEKQLIEIQQVAQFDSENEPEGHRLAHALSHWEDSFARFLGDLVPKLAEEHLSAEELISHAFQAEWLWSAAKAARGPAAVQNRRLSLRRLGAVKFQPRVPSTVTLECGAYSRRF